MFMFTSYKWFIALCYVFLCSWYAGSISERKTEQVLTKLEKGAFLVRESLLPDADYVLSVKYVVRLRCNYIIMVSSITV